MSEKPRQITFKRQYGPGFLPCLALLLIGLKLGGVINWHWLLVLLPLLWWLYAIVAIAAAAALVGLSWWLSGLITGGRR